MSAAYPEALGTVLPAAPFPPSSLINHMLQEVKSAIPLPQVGQGGAARTAHPPLYPGYDISAQGSWYRQSLCTHRVQPPCA